MFIAGRYSLITLEAVNIDLGIDLFNEVYDFANVFCCESLDSLSQLFTGLTLFLAGGGGEGSEAPIRFFVCHFQTDGDSELKLS